MKLNKWWTHIYKRPKTTVVEVQDGRFYFLVALVFLTWLFVNWADNKLPEPLTRKDAIINPDKFIEERARDDLYDLTRCPSRVHGSIWNDIITVDLLMKKVNEIKAVSPWTIEVEAQSADGAFFIDDDGGYIDSYKQVPNVIAKLQGYKNSSFLFNCHFDTKADSPGATDNMISCVVMLEMLRVLATARTPPVQTLIFLFNGAEEWGLQGAHAFAVHHRFNDTVKGFVNLEGAGAGGREILFQSGPGDSWILDGYLKGVERPYGTCIGEEAFQNGMIPSDTDFRIFRDFSNIPGLDMAFIKNGYVYHTNLDKIGEIPPGSIQHMGDNALGLARYFGYESDLDIMKKSEDKTVFFDFLGAFMISYPEDVGKALDTVFAILTLIYLLFLCGTHCLRKGWWKELLLSLFGVLGSWIVGLGIPIGIGQILRVSGYPSSFHSLPGLAIPLFGFPALTTQLLILALIFRKRKNGEDLAWGGSKGLIAIAAISTTPFARFPYVFTLNVLFSVPAHILRKLLFKKKEYWGVVFYLYIGELIPMMYLLYLLRTLLDIFVPTMGRLGDGVDPNIIIPAITSTFVLIPTATGILPLFVKSPIKNIWAAVGFTCLLLTPLISFGLIGRIPYTHSTPMRIRINEFEQMHFNGDGTLNSSQPYFHFWTWDPNTRGLYDTLEKSASLLKQKTEIDMRNCQRLHCDLPFLWPAPSPEVLKRVDVIKKDTHVPKNVVDQVNVEIQRESLPNGERLTFQFKGSHQNSILFYLAEDVDLVDWSLTEQIPEHGEVYNGRKSYFIYHGVGFSNEAMEISCDFSYNKANTQRLLLEINFTAFFYFGEDQKSDELKHFIDKFPEWTFPLGTTAVTHIRPVYKDL